MKIKTKQNKYRFKILSVLVLLVLCFSIAFNNKETIQVCHALASWNPVTGFQPGISATLPGDNITPIITPTVPYIPSLSDSMNADGSLKAYSSLKVKNDKISTDYSGGWTYGSFVEYFTVKRTDGRKIYDDDGVFDVSWWKNGDFGYSDEIIDYQSEIWVKTTLCQYNWNGFLGTVLNAKFESGAYFDITWDRGEDPDDSISVNVHDKDANTMGSGKYRNWGINPGNESYKLCDWDYCSSPYITIVLRGTAYWENGWWGGTGNKVSNLYSFMSGFMPRSNRIWSNTLSANNGAIQVGNNFFCAQPFVATASNLNNFVKVNDIKMTPITDKNVIPFKEGFRIAIADEGKTKVSIENGGENQYTDYNCFVDSCIPDVNLVYLNSNGLDRLQESAVSISSTGAKSQVVSGGIFKDQVQINFGANENESPEKAYVTYNGLSREIASGTWLSEDGDYKVVVQDLAGNSKTVKFTIDTHSPNYNVDRLANTKEYKVSKWYLTAIPYGFSDYGTYSYLNYDEAIAKAKTSERQNLVTNYTLNNIDDFHYTNLVASGDEIKTGSYWYYKSINNPDLYVYYFTESLLDEAIEKYAKSYVSSPKYFNYKSDIFPNDYGTIISSDIYHNLWNESKTPAYISNDFVFRQQSELESYKIYYDYIEDGQNGWTEFVYNISFKEQTNGHGLYLIKEIDYVGHETYCYAFLDLQAPVLDVTAKVYGANDSFNHTISKNNIPLNGELIFYYEDFKINQIIEDDTWYVMQIKNPDGTVNRYTYEDTLPNFDDMPTGEYQITLYDRVNNNFSFKICLLAKHQK